MSLQKASPSGRWAHHCVSIHPGNGLPAGGLLVVVLPEVHKTTRGLAELSPMRGPAGGPGSVSELLFLSKAISVALNKRLLTVGRRVIHHTDLYFSLSVSCSLASGTVLEQRGLLGNGSHRD